jgi:pantoate--beta-alanine ligase
VKSEKALSNSAGTLCALAPLGIYPPPVVVARSIAEFESLPFAGRCVLVPTMGALHAGHAALIAQAVSLARRRELSGGCVVTIFVNPTQFNDPADLERYPRTLDEDLEICEDEGAACVLVPRIEDVYPRGLAEGVPPLPAVATQPGLEDAHRPGHFSGVCQVVKRLFEIARPVAAMFGEKDWQQLQVIRAMVREQNCPVEIVPVPTVREPDGLALSSRNRFLSPEDRTRALSLFRALRASRRAATPDEAESIMCTELRASGVEPEYAVVREAESLLRPPFVSARTSWRALIAARIGLVRLIDNDAWERSAAR